MSIEIWYIDQTKITIEQAIDIWYDLQPNTMFYEGAYN